LEGSFLVKGDTSAGKQIRCSDRGDRTDKRINRRKVGFNRDELENLWQRRGVNFTSFLKRV